VKILWVKAGGLVPPDIGGKIRSYHIVKQLARCHEVTLFTFYAAFPDDPHAELQHLLHRSICLPLQIPERGTIGDYLNLGRGIASGLAYSVVKYCQPQMRKQLQELTRANHFDVIVCDFVLPAEIIPWEAPCPKVVFTHNVEATIFKRHHEVAANPLWKLICLREYRSMERFERTQLNRADRVLTVSNADRDAFVSYLPVNKIDVIPTGVDIDYFRPGDQSSENPAELVFTGSMDWMPNEDGIFYFVEEILPAVRARIPEVTLTIIGRKPSERLKQLAARFAGIHVTGRVEDIRPYVDKGAVYIVPLRVGSGTRLKIFEAMAMGKAIVTTTIGAEGLPVNSGKDVLFADDPSQFAKAVIQLIVNPEQRRRIGQAARQLVEEHFSWSSVAAVFESALQQACEQHSQRALATSAV
jgi:sugar transferase (PEP-CTERM/EpsH1 system associated)